jgi:hypothetical protein
VRGHDGGSGGSALGFALEPGWVEREMRKEKESEKDRDHATRGSGGG